MKFNSGIFAVVTLPVLIMFFRFLVDGTMSAVVVNYWYPFDAFKPQNFIFALTWLELIAYLSLVHSLAADSLLYGLISVLRMEFDVLRHDLTNLKDCSIKEWNESIKRLAERHNKLLRVSNRLQNIYGPSFLCCFLTTSLVLCFIAFQLSTANHIAVYLFNIFYLGLICLQIFLLCYFCQKVINSSEGVADGIYDCGWERIEDESFKRHLIPMMMMSQNGVKLSAMSFFEVSIESYSAVS